MLDIIEYLRHYTDRVHHPREDAAFAFLAQRRPNMQLELEHLSQEHRVLAQAGEMLLKYLNGIIEGEIVPRAEVEATAATYVLYYRNHMATEEKEVLTRAAQTLTQEEWAAVGPRRRPAMTRFSEPARRSATSSCACRSRWNRSRG
jgi:hemerythrin-like domain-containing protein